MTNIQIMAVGVSLLTAVVVAIVIHRYQDHISIELESKVADDRMGTGGGNNGSTQHCSPKT